ncbi:MAG: urease accessory protein UreF [Candidatus Eiseniibacteriota bacterium]
MRRRTRQGMSTSMSTDENALYHLLTWLSPSYPVGAFAHSSGVEWAVEAGWIADRTSLEAWLDAVLTAGAAWNDSVLFVHAYRAALAGDHAALAEVAELAAAAHPALERRLESLAQGDAFRRIALATALEPQATALVNCPDDGLAYPVAVASLAAGHAIALQAALTAYLHAFVANLVSAAQRLVPLGQTDGQKTILALAPIVAQAVKRAVALPPGDPFAFLGSATWMADLASMAHETQYTRLFRT